MDKIRQLHQKYAPSSEAFELVYTHCQIVAEIALWCADNAEEKVDRSLLEEAALLHDIGAYTFFVPEIKSFKRDGYQQHALIGAEILSQEGFSKEVVDIIRSHLLMGVTADEIKSVGWKLPYQDFIPQTLESEIVNYADRFHSKHPRFNHPDTFKEGLSKELPLQAEKFEKAMKRFGAPDIEKLAAKYDHPIN